MNILLIIPYNWGTIGLVSYNLYKSILEYTDHNVYVACLGNYSSNGRVFSNCFHFQYDNRKHWDRNLFLLKRIKRKYQINVSISTLVNANYWNVLTSIGDYKVGVFHTRLNQARSRGIIFYSIQYILNKTLANRLDKKIAVNKSAYYDAKKFLGNNVELVYNIHNFMSIDKMAKEDLSGEEKNIFSKSVVLFVGSGSPKLKAPERTILSFSRIHKNLKNYNLVFLGKWDLKTSQYLQNLVSEEGISDRVYFLGYKKNPYKYMKRADLLVTSSRDEGLPGVLIEALSLGTKCVSTNSSQGVWEIMECDEQYTPHLKDLFKTKYGYIVPNDVENEAFTIQKLGEGIMKSLQTSSFLLKDFNKERFSAQNIVFHFLNH